jgi:hypothetical protein
MFDDDFTLPNGRVPNEFAWRFADEAIRAVALRGDLEVLEGGGVPHRHRHVKVLAADPRAARGKRNSMDHPFLPPQDGRLRAAPGVHTRRV